MTEKGSTYSQTPCSRRGKMHTLTHSNLDLKLPTERHFKALNNIEKQQIVHNLKRKLNSKRQQAAFLSRNRDRNSRLQQARLDNIQNEEKKKRTIREVRKKLKSINKQYLKSAKSLNKQIAQLEEQLAQFQ